MPEHPTLALIDRALPERCARAVRLWVGEFYPFQQEWLLDLRRFAALDKCRQIGGSHTFGAWGVLRGVWGEPCVYVSKTEPDAVDVLAKARKHAEVLSELGCDWADIMESTQLQITLRSGAVIRATTSTAAGRGFSGNVVIDEYAYHEHQADTWDAAVAATTHGFSCRVLSTPNGVGDEFHRLCTEVGHRDPSNPHGWLVYLTTLEDARKDGMNALSEQEAWDMAKGDPRIYDQLFRGVFLDNDMQYIPSALIARQTTDGEADAYGESWAGIDIGEKRDKTCLVVVRGSSELRRVAHVEVHDRTDDILLERLIADAFNVHNVTRLALDGTGMGTFPAKAAKRRWGPRVEDVQFTNKSKEELASRLYQSLSDARLELPRKATDLRDDIASIRRIVTPSGAARFDAPRTVKGHADRAWALMLAEHAAGNAIPKSAYAKLKAAANGRR